MSSKLDHFFNKKFVYAVVGATNNEDKYGFKIVKILKDNGFKVIPINPHEKEIYGLEVFKSLSDVKEKIDVVDFVVPPKITLKVLEEVLDLGIRKVWFQPKSFDFKCEKFCYQHRIIKMTDFCLYEQSLKFVE